MHISFCIFSAHALLRNTLPNMLKIASLDHLVLTVQDIQTTCDFYCNALGMELVRFGEGRVALSFGQQKFNLHQAGKEFEPKAQRPTPGAIDLCLLTATPIKEVIEYLNNLGIAIVEGPVRRTGAQGPILSVYVRDPDQNLIEISNQLSE